MDCREWSLKLDELLHGELPDEEKEKVLSHILECEKCRKEYDDAIELKRRFDSLIEKSERSLADSVVAEIRKETNPYKKTPFLVRHIGLAASFVFILVLALYAGISDSRKDISDMYISEEEASVTDAAAPDFIADVKNSATLDSDYSFAILGSVFDGTSVKQESATDDYFYYSDSVNSKPSESVTYPEPTAPEECPEAPAPEPEAPMPDTEAENVEYTSGSSFLKAETVTIPTTSEDQAMEESTTDSAVVKVIINENIDSILPLLCDFDLIEVGENYVVINADDYDEAMKIIENEKLKIEN